MSTLPTFTETYQADPDRGTWPAGPWTDEPDKVVWVDEATGLDCMARRGGGGAWCGYVGLKADHPWHGKGYSDSEPPVSPQSVQPLRNAGPTRSARRGIRISCAGIFMIVRKIACHYNRP